MPLRYKLVFYDEYKILKSMKPLWSKYTLVVVILGLTNFNLPSQSKDTIFSLKEYIENIHQHHPIAKKANLKIQFADTELLEAKGNFDPVIDADWDQKNFSDKLYYRRYNANLRLPKSLGIDIVSGYENTDGDFLNPENKTDNLGLWHLGIEVNLLQGLFINDRRIAIQKAKVYKKLAINDRQNLLNELLYNATTAYFIWQKNSYVDEVLKQNLEIASSYFNNTKEAYESGEKTALDTLEASISYQDAMVQLQKNKLGLIKSKQLVENFLWFNDLPVKIEEKTKPENYQNKLFSNPVKLENIVLESHPIILSSINKKSIIEIEQKLKREKLKPKLKLKYNPLLSTSADNIAPNFSKNDFKWGLGFSFPLLLRSERANVQKGRLKIEETRLDIKNKENELRNKIESSWQQKQLLNKQIDLLVNNVENYKLLLEGENEKFNLGESSVFLLNKRQEKYISGQIKLIETYIKKQIQLLNYLYYTNQLLPR